jgi:hypothetical protein
MKRINHRGTEAQRMMMVMLMLIGVSIVDCRSAQAAVGLQVALDGAAGVIDVPIGARRVGINIGLENHNMFPLTFRWDKEMRNAECGVGNEETPPKSPRYCVGGDGRSAYNWFVGHRINLTRELHPVYEMLIGIRARSQIEYIWGEVFTGIRFSPVRWQLGIGIQFRIKN